MERYNICLVGNPNTGKSSIFNKLTKLKQHTGNWAGKTVGMAKGYFTYENNQFDIVDVPGTYSLFGLTEEEIIAREYICFTPHDCLVVLSDATCLERSLLILLQAIQYSQKIVLVVNLIDEANNKNIIINRLGLAYSLGVPVVFTSPKTNTGIEQLKKTIYNVLTNKISISPVTVNHPLLSNLLDGAKKCCNNSVSNNIALRVLDSDEEFLKHLLLDKDVDINKVLAFRKNIDINNNRKIIVNDYNQFIKQITKKYVYYKDSDALKKDKKIDNVLSSKKFGIPIMFLMLFVIFFITIKLANYPSMLLSNFFTIIENFLIDTALNLGLSTWLSSFLFLGIFHTLTQVVAVMLPPMAIFFPLFTFLEDLGFLPRIAYNTDFAFQKVGCCGKQSLTMCMGFGCNASAILGTRIIDSKKEKLIAILTNTFVPCNGRFPLIFVLTACFFTNFSSSFANAIIPALLAVSVVMFGIIVTLVVSKVLSKTLLKGEASSFTLELTPYRKPNVLSILYRSLIDRTLIVLGRAVVIAAPMGGIIWLLANINIGDISIASHIHTFLEPFGSLFGLDGVILLAFILALPANEIVLPLILMLYTAGGHLEESDNISHISQILITNGWTIKTVVCTLLFSLLHFPCSTTLISIYKETKSKKWTLVAFLLPTLIAFLVCFLVSLLFTIL